VKCPHCNRSMRDEAALARHAERTQPCAGTSKTARPGEPCDTCVAKPATVCRFHGAGAPQVKAAVERRRQEDRARSLVAKFALPTEIHYGQALMENLWRWTGMVNYLAGKIGEFENDDELKQLSIGAGREKFERPAVWVEMYQTALREQRVSAKACADVGIDERLTQMVERQGQALNAVIRALAAGIFAGLAARGMDGEELRRFEAEQLPQVVRAAVMTIRPPGELQRGA
jgi:hypothetical protein